MWTEFNMQFFQLVFVNNMCPVLLLVPPISSLSWEYFLLLRCFLSSIYTVASRNFNYLSIFFSFFLSHYLLLPLLLLLISISYSHPLSPSLTWHHISFSIPLSPYLFLLTPLSLPLSPHQSLLTSYPSHHLLLSFFPQTVRCSSPSWWRSSHQLRGKHLF